MLDRFCGRSRASARDDLDRFAPRLDFDRVLVGGIGIDESVAHAAAVEMYPSPTPKTYCA
jgi:hypothetical protein